MRKFVGDTEARGSREVLTGVAGALALTAPNFSRATAYVVALPDAAYALPVLLAALAALYVMFANRLPRCRQGLTLILSVACVAFEAACAWAQRTCPDWNYLSVNAGLSLAGRALRLAAFCSLALQAGRGEGLRGKAGRRAAACLAASGVASALALWCLGEYGCPREATLALGLAGWLYLAALVALGMGRGHAAGIPFAHGSFAFLIGAFIGIDVATILGSGSAPGADASWALPISAALAAASFVPMSAPWARGATAEAAGGTATAASGREGRIASALGAIPGADALSEREAQVAAAELSGATDADIASELGLKPQTVATYRSRAYQKLGVSSRAGLVGAARSCSAPAGTCARGNGSGASAPLPIARRSAALRAALGTVVLLLLAVLLRMSVPLPAQRVALLAASAALLAKGAAGLARAGGWGAPGEGGFGQVGTGQGGSGRAGFEPQVVAGCICACAGAVVSPQLPVLYGWRALAAPVATFLCLVWVECAARDASTRALTALTCGVVGLLTVQAGLYGLQASVPWPQLAMPLAGLLAVATLGIDKRLAERELSDALLVGEARCDSYLRGRGLSELEASVLILSAKRLSRAAIAESLAISVATVSTYRSRGVKKLGAEDLEAAFRLMREEGGLDAA
ncbi:MAG: LuxR C-terminal-related transcriptional regulator [Coriobacteriia bacterium]|nr:LuxR C-terminal-related transcriptional regulator [Coriobacteriia bacterium]